MASCQQPKLDSNQLTGTYAAQCCGTINVKDDVISLRGELPVRFSFRRDNVGYFILPQNKIGVKGGAVVKLAGDPTYIRVTGGDDSLILAVEDESRDELHYFSRQ